MPTAAEAPAEIGRVDAALAGPDADPRLAVVLLEEDGDVGRGRLAEQVDEALGVLRPGARRQVVLGGQRRPDEASVELVARRPRTSPKSRSCRLGLVR